MDKTEALTTVEELKAMQMHESKSINSETSVLRVPGGWIYTFMFATSENRVMEFNFNHVFVPELK